MMFRDKRVSVARMRSWASELSAAIITDRSDINARHIRVALCVEYFGSRVDNARSNASCRRFPLTDLGRRQAERYAWGLVSDRQDYDELFREAREVQ